MWRKKPAFRAGAAVSFDDERACDIKVVFFFFEGSQHFSYFAVDLESVISYESPGGESAQLCMTNSLCQLTGDFYSLLIG